MRRFNGKIRVEILLVIFLLSVTGCSVDRQHKKEAKVEIEREIDELSTESIYDSETEENSSLITEEADKTDVLQEETQEKQVREEMNGDGIDIFSMGKNISYPYFRVGMSDYAEFLSSINMLIYQDVEEHCNEILQYYELNYEITYLGTDYISILYQGMRMPPESAHSTDIAWGTTINMHTGEMAAVEEVIEMAELKDKLEQKKFENVKGIMDEIDRSCYEQYMNYNIDADDERHYHDYYLKQDKIGILFGISHAIGDYVIVEIDR